MGFNDSEAIIDIRSIPSGPSTSCEKPDNEHSNSGDKGAAQVPLNETTSHSIDPDHERRVRLKIDLAIIPLAALIYLVCFIDRTNIGNARLAGLEQDLNLHGYDFNSVNSYFYVSYIVFEIPSNFLCKVLGPGWVLPFLTIGFGLLTVASAYVENYSQLAACRFLLGAFEAGIMPGLAYYLSRWYRRSELTFRISLYVVMAPLAGAFGGLLASAILRFDGLGPRIPAGSWRAIFVVEGVLTVVVGLLCLAVMTDQPSSARFLSEEERQLAVDRLMTERIGTGAVLDKMSVSKLVKGAFNPVTAMTSVVFMFCSLSVQGLALFTPSIVRSIYPDVSPLNLDAVVRVSTYDASQETVTTQQLRTAPPYAIGAGCLLLVCFASWRLHHRQLFMVLCAPPMIAGYLIFLVTNETHFTARYAGVCLMASTSFILGPLCLAQASANVSSDTSRNMAIGICMFFSNVGSLVSTWSFLPTDAPNYPIGCGLNCATSVLIFVAASLGWLWMRWDNRRRDGRDVEAELERLSSEEGEELEWRHPAFRWRV